jgi:hypothetical protein
MTKTHLFQTIVQLDLLILRKKKIIINIKHIIVVNQALRAHKAMLGQ